ncbi:hypothetical protein ES705_37923 [subsurface metagenome]
MMKGLYYYTKKIYQFSQSKLIFNILSGKIITTTLLPLTFFYFLFRYGPMRSKMMNKKLDRLDKFAKGLILCHSGDNRVPQGQNFKRVFVYHATCDKTFAGAEGKIGADWFEYFFLTGDKDLYKLKNYTYNPEILEGKIVKIGMFRSDTIFNKSYNKENILKRYRIKTGNKKIILYAPTWKWGGGSLGVCFETFVQEIPKKYVLIIRPHYNDSILIKEILKWQRKHKVKDFYFFPRQYQDIMNFIYISDLLIGDNSSVNYTFSITKRPIVMVKTKTKDVFIPPDEYNIKLCGPLYDPKSDNILEKVDEAFSNSLYRKRIEKLVEKSFYFNDGHAVDRACSFIVDKLGEMGIIDRDKIINKYKNKFQYFSNYK